MIFEGFGTLSFEQKTFILDPAAHGRGPRSGRRLRARGAGQSRSSHPEPSPRPSATLGASLADPGRGPPHWSGLRLGRARQNTILSHRRSTDLTKGAVRPPTCLTGIPSTLVIPNRSPHPGARHEVSRAQPFPRGASLDLWQYTLNLYSVYAGCSLKMPLRGDTCRGFVAPRG